jgi:hypothetical protein
MSNVPQWSPPLYQTITYDANQQPVYGDVYFDKTVEGGPTTSYNVYSLNYVTTFTMLDGTFTFPNVLPGAAESKKVVPGELVNMRNTLIGVIPLINISSNNKNVDISFSFPSNNHAISVVKFDRDYFVNPQPSGLSDNAITGYRNSGAENIFLPYRNALVINGIYDGSGGLVYGQTRSLFRMEMRQAAYEGTGINGDISYDEKKIVVPITIIKASSSLAIKPFSGIGKYTIENSDTNGMITREYLDGSFNLIFNDFATTTRKNVVTGAFDYSDIIYYLKLTDIRTFQFSNDNISISENKITFKRVTILADGTYSPIPIKFLQEETAMYDRSTQRIGDSNGFMTTIKINIIKSTPTFDGQSPAVNTGLSTTVYRLTDVNKMTTERAFTITPPVSNNSDPEATFVMTSSDNRLLKVDKAGTTYTAFIYGPGTVTVTITQPSTTNFNAKSASFDVNIFNISPPIINCNFNLFYTNPYNREFWTRFKPECRSSNLLDSVTNTPLTVSQVDEVYDMRRKAEILKYNKNVGGLTKSQKYAKASRGELMRKIGNEQNYISETNGGITTLICPSGTSNTRITCGLTSACGVPGKERLLCYDPSINLYNYKRTYQYQAGLQVPSNIQTSILTEPTNLRIKYFDIINNKVTLEWDAPDSNGGLPIVGYVITFSENNNTWAPYKSVFPYKPTNAAEAAATTFNKLSGEINGNTVIFERIPNLIEIRANTIYYISVFSGNERGLSSVPATIIVKTSSVPSIINDFTFTNTTDERQNLMVDLKWSDPMNTGTTPGTFNGPPIYQYNLYYRKVPMLTWTKDIVDLSNVIIQTVGTQQRRFILRNLENQNKYDIKIEPVNSIGTGPESAIITARTLMKPSVPLNVVLTPKYGLLPGIITDVSRNYFNISWDKPDTGGAPITIYYITITPPSPLQPITINYPVGTTDTQTTFNTDIGRIEQDRLIVGTYTVILQSYNGYLNSIETAPASVTLKSSTTIPNIKEIIGYYNSGGLQTANLTFSIDNLWVAENTISTVKVKGLNIDYDVKQNIFGQPIAGTGEHTISIPATTSSDIIITLGQTYNVSITLVFSLTGEETTSVATYSYTPPIRYV